MKEKCDDTVITTRLQKFASAFIIQAPCIICKDKLVKVGDTYDLVDFLDNGGLNVRAVKFMNAYMKGYNVVIVVLDMKTGELLKRSHRLNNASLPCDWVLTDLFYRMPESKEQLLFDSRDPD